MGFAHNPTENHTLCKGGFDSLKSRINKEITAHKAVDDLQHKIDELNNEIRRSKKIKDDLGVERDATAEKISKGCLAGTSNAYIDINTKATKAFYDERHLYDELAETQSKLQMAVKESSEVESSISDDQRKLFSDMKKLNAEEEQLITYAKPFFIMPREMLTLVLTLSMGMFGSSIAVSREIIQPTTMQRRLLWVLVRPLQGAVIALAIFILAKAGITVFSSQSSGSVVPIELNPFTIGLLGIVSGLYADHAYEYLERVATRFFQTTNNTQSKVTNDKKDADKLQHP